MTYNVATKYQVHSAKYGYLDTIVILNRRMYVGAILFTSFKNNEIWHNVATYGWIAESKILCSLRRAC